MNLFINLNASSPESALQTSQTVTTQADNPAFTYGDTDTINVYLCDGAGAIDDSSGNTDYAITVAIGDPGGVPDGGTFTATCGSTSAALAYNISAADLQTALNALTTVASEGEVTVIGTAPLFQITHKTVGAKTAITGSGTLLTPIGKVKFRTITTGDGSHYNVQLMQLIQAPLVELALVDANVVAGPPAGWSKSFPIYSYELADHLRTDASDGKLSTYLEVQRTTDSNSYVRTVLQVPCTIKEPAY